MTDDAVEPKRGTDLDAIAAVFDALAHASRRHVLLVLRFRGGEMTAGDIAARFQCSWPTTTRHLKILVHAGLVRMEKRGRERVYRLDRARLRNITTDWLRWFDDEPVPTLLHPPPRPDTSTPTKAGRRSARGS
jgi:DNA-binding transcriptional ArsR family regulator